MKAFVTACFMLLLGAPTAQAQLSDAQVVSRLRGQPATPQLRREECSNKPLHVVESTAAGAVAGWVAFMVVGLGIFASDHGDVYTRNRRRFMIGGAVLGAGKGLYDAATTDCLHFPERTPRRGEP